MNKKIFIIAVFIIGLSSLAICARASVDMIPSLLLNGDTWNKLDKATKLFYLVGFNDGYSLGFGIRDIYKHKSSEELKLENILIEKAKSMGKMNKEQMVEGMDQFYSDFANIKISACFAYDFVMRKIKGDSEKDIQSDIEKARANFSQIQ